MTKTPQPTLTIALTTYEKSFIQAKMYRMLYSLFFKIEPTTSREVLEIFDEDRYPDFTQ